MKYLNYKIMNDNLYVYKAVLNTKKLNKDYWDKLLLQRAGKSKEGNLNKKNCGSIYLDLTEEEIEKKILTSNWKYKKTTECNYLHFQASIKGQLGIIELTKLPLETKIYLSDFKKTGFAQATIKVNAERFSFQKSEFTTLIISNFNETPQIITFHPGVAIKPSKLLISEFEKKKFH